jgi:Tol biopolymer transport system component
VLYYVRGGEWLARRRLVWVDRQSDEVEPLPLPAGAYSQPHLSPDGRRVAFTKFERDAFNIWVYESASGRATQRTFESNNFLPTWRPDGTELTFTTYRRGPFSVYCVPAEGIGSEVPLVTGTYDREACSWSPDGTSLLFVETDPNTNGDVWLFPVQDANAARVLLRESWDERQAVFSPDGDWIAYVSDVEGRPEVYVTPYPGPGESERVSTDGGYQPVWLRDGKELFYRSGSKMMAATIETEPELRVTGSKVLFEGQYLTGYHRNYDVSSDGQRFLMIKEAEGQPAAIQLVVVLNWFEELKRLVPAGERRL